MATASDYNCTMGVSIHEALLITEDSTKPFSIGFAAFNAGTNKGGQLIELPACKRVGASHNRRDNDTIVVQPLNNGGHPYTVHQFMILNINGMEVFV